MSWYSTGTVQVTNGSTAVVGTGTGWFGALQFGWGFVGPDGRLYEITAVASDTSLTLATPYQGSTAAAQTYAAVPTAGTEVGLVQAIQTLLAGFQTVKDGPGQGKFSGNVVLASDPDTGLSWPSSNEVALLAGNVVQLALKAGAATGAAVQSGPTDSAAGKLLTVGAFGLGSYPTSLTDTNALDAITHTGWHRVASANVAAVNGPSDASGGVVLTEFYSSSNIYQTFKEVAGVQGRSWTRSYSGGSWNPWQQVTRQGDPSFVIGDGAAGPGIADELVISRDTVDVGLSLLCRDDSGYVRVYLGSQSNIQAAKLQHRENGGELTLQAEGDLILQTGGTTTRAVLAADGSSYFNGNLGVGAQSAYRLAVTEPNDAIMARLIASNASYSQRLIQGSCDRAATSAYDFFRFYSGGLVDLEAQLTGTGNLLLDGAVTPGGADYSEYFEYLDGNPAGEDRRGVAVVLEGDKIRPAVAGEHPIGVISATPSVIGDGDMDRWKGKYLRDAFGAYLWEDYEVVEWTEVVTEAIPASEEGGDPQTVTRDVPHSYAVDALPDGVQVPPDATRSIQQRRVLNPAYDPDQPYLPRSERPEWALVGLLGKLRIRSGQPTAPSWIKMRDVSAEVAEWLVK